MIFKYDIDQIECDKVIKKDDSIILYDTSGNVIMTFLGVQNYNWFTIEGGKIEVEISHDEKLQSQIDYISMMTGIELEVNDE